MNELFAIADARKRRKKDKDQDYNHNVVADRLRDKNIQDQLRFLDKELDLMKLEHEEEIRIKTESPAPRRQGVNNLRFLYCEPTSKKFMVTFISDQDQDNNLGFRGVVMLGCQSDKQFKIEGLIYNLTQNQIQVIFNRELYLSSTDLYHLYQITRDSDPSKTYSAIDFVRDRLTRGGNQIVDQLFGHDKFGDISPTPRSLSYHYSNLNDEQKDSVIFALDQTNSIAIIHGPPGTGKTTTLIEIILQCVLDHGKKVLVTAPSNVAVDNLLQKLINHNQDQNQDKKINLIRIGVGISTSYLDYSLESILDKKFAFSELSQKERKQERDKIENQMITSANVILTTLSSASHINKSHRFDYLIIDECSQSIEANCYVPLPLIDRKVIIAGDHKQLPPTIISQEAAIGGLEFSLMERLLQLIRSRSDLGQDKNLVRMLTTQYRMHNDIMKWSSDKFYDSRLIAHDSVANRTLYDLIPATTVTHILAPLVLIDTQGRGKESSNLSSFGNEYEAEIVAKYGSNLVNNYHISPDDIGVIAPYNYQVSLICDKLSSQRSLKLVEVSSVDGFQGREKEVIIISCVRTNRNQEIGFLSEARRINVAVTRAKRHLVVICDVRTLSYNEILRSLIEHMKRFGEAKFSSDYLSRNLIVSQSHL